MLGLYSVFVLVFQPFGDAVWRQKYSVCNLLHEAYSHWHFFHESNLQAGFRLHPAVFISFYEITV